MKKVWTPNVQAVEVRQVTPHPQKVQPEVTLVEVSDDGDIRPLVVEDPIGVWYELAGEGVKRRGKMKPRSQAPGSYFHTPVALKGNPLRMVVKLVNDQVNVAPLFDADVAVG